MLKTFDIKETAVEKSYYFTVVTASGEQADYHPDYRSSACA